MTGLALDWQTVTAKLVMMRRRLTKLGLIVAESESWTDEARGDDDDVELDLGSRIEAHLAERILILLVDLAVDINRHVAAVDLGKIADDDRKSFPLAADAGMISADLAGKLAPSVGTRNVLLNRLEVDPPRLVLEASRAVEQYGEYVRQVAAYVQNRSGGR